MGITHQPTFDPCTGLAVALGEQEPQLFRVEGDHVALLDSLPLKTGTQQIALRLGVVPRSPQCGKKKISPIVITGVGFYDNLFYRPHLVPVTAPEVSLKNFWEVEEPAGQAFAWSRESSQIIIGGLAPRARYGATLLLRSVGQIDQINLGCRADESVPIALGHRHEVKIANSIRSDAHGEITICIRSDTWQPKPPTSGATDTRKLGIAVSAVKMIRRGLHR